MILLIALFLSVLLFTPNSALAKSKAQPDSQIVVSYKPGKSPDELKIAVAVEKVRHGNLLSILKQP